MRDGKKTLVEYKAVAKAEFATRRVGVYHIKFCSSNRILGILADTGSVYC